MSEQPNDQSSDQSEARVPDAPGPDTETDAGDVDQDSEPSTNAPAGEAVDDPEA